MGVGADRLIKEQDAFARCMKRADTKLYEDKDRLKEKGLRSGTR